MPWAKNASLPDGIKLQLERKVHFPARLPSRSPRSRVFSSLALQRAFGLKLLGFSHSPDSLLLEWVKENSCGNRSPNRSGEATVALHTHAHPPPEGAGTEGGPSAHLPAPPPCRVPETGACSRAVSSQGGLPPAADNVAFIPALPARPALRFSEDSVDVAARPLARQPQTRVDRCAPWLQRGGVATRGAVSKHRAPGPARTTHRPALTQF